MEKGIGKFMAPWSSVSKQVQDVSPEKQAF